MKIADCKCGLTVWIRFHGADRFLECEGCGYLTRPRHHTDLDDLIRDHNNDMKEESNGKSDR